MTKKKITIESLSGTVDGLVRTVDDLAGTVDDLAGTVDDLAKTMKKGFDEVGDQFKENVAMHKLTRMELAKDEDMRAVKGTVNTLYEMLDDEARFIQQMRAEYPLFIKRLERVEKKLGLPHRLFDTGGE